MLKHISAVFLLVLLMSCQAESVPHEISEEECLTEIDGDFQFRVFHSWTSEQAYNGCTTVISNSAFLI